MKNLESDINDVLSIAGTLGLDSEDVRMLLSDTEELDNNAIETRLKYGQTLYRLNVASRLYQIIESPETAPRDLIAANKHLKEVHSKISAETSSQELLVLLRETIPSKPADGTTYDEYEYEEEENDED